MDTPPTFSERLTQQVRAKRSALCVGLDPRFASLPPSIRGDVTGGAAARATAYREFCCGIVDAVAPLVPIVKPQAAFFEQLGPAGMVALAHVVRHAASRELIVVLDGKRNDIGSTAEAYADAYLGAGDLSPWGADSLTVSPYLGADSLEPFVDVCDRRAAGIFVLVKTSNPGGGLLQDRETGGQTVYQTVADLVERLNRSRRDAGGYGPVGAVVGATYPEQLAELRGRMPSAWILIPGFGAQGGGAEDTAAGFDASGLGAVVNSSRHILFAYQRSEYAERFGPRRWQEAAEAAARDAVEQLKGATPMGRLEDGR